MANSSIIGKAKVSIVKSLINDEDIVTAIDATDIEENEDLINSHIFDFNQNPYTIDEVTTFLTVQIHIPTQHHRSQLGGSFIQTIVEVWVISHVNHMVVKEIPKVKQNRNDYISQLLDDKLNGSSDFGIGKLVLVSNEEGSFQNDYVYRRMTFSTIDINNSFCKGED